MVYLFDYLLYSLLGQIETRISLMNNKASQQGGVVCKYSRLVVVARCGEVWYGMALSRCSTYYNDTMFHASITR